MNTFPGWRTAARAMRYARQQHAQVDTLTSGRLTDTRWRLNGIDVRVGRTDIAETNDLRISGDGLDIWIDRIDAARALRVLAALDLIPADMAVVHEETGERCTWCHRLGHAADRHPLPKTHPQYDAFYDASDDELAEILASAQTPGRENP